MSKLKLPGHAKGPWKIVKNRLGVGKFSIESSEGYWVTSTVGGLEESQELANATLIAAAPNLHQALTNLVKAVNRKEPDPLEMFVCIELARGALRLVDRAKK